MSMNKVDKYVAIAISRKLKVSIDKAKTIIQKEESKRKYTDSYKGDKR